MAAAAEQQQLGDDGVSTTPRSQHDRPLGDNSFDNPFHGHNNNDEGGASAANTQDSAVQEMVPLALADPGGHPRFVERRELVQILSGTVRNAWKNSRLAGCCCFGCLKPQGVQGTHGVGCPNKKGTAGGPPPPADISIADVNFFNLHASASRDVNRLARFNLTLCKHYVEILDEIMMARPGQPRLTLPLGWEPTEHPHMGSGPAARGAAPLPPFTLPTASQSQSGDGFASPSQDGAAAAAASSSSPARLAAPLPANLLQAAASTHQGRRVNGIYGTSLYSDQAGGGAAAAARGGGPVPLLAAAAADVAASQDGAPAAAAAPAGGGGIAPAPPLTDEEAADSRRAIPLTVGWEAISATRIAVVKKLFPSVQHWAADLFAKLIAAVERQPTSEFFWWRLFAFPKLVLFRFPPHEGARTNTIMKERCQRFVQHQYESLFDSAKEATAPTRVVEDAPMLDVDDNAYGLGLPTDIDALDMPPATLNRVVKLAKEGLLSRAMQQMACAKVAPVDAVNTAAMRDLHPEPLRPTHIPAIPAEARAALDGWKVTEKSVKQMLRKFTPGSAGGLSGLAPGVLLHMTADPVAGVATRLARLVELIARGAVPAAARPYIFGARLIALAKKDGGLRPVACGDAVRRLAAKLLLAKVMPDVRLLHQIGIGRKHATDAYVQLFRAFCEAQRNNPDAGVMALDFSNAFNSCDRSAMLAEAAVTAPGLLQYLIAAYGEVTYLFFGAERILSRGGAQQGDPAGVIAFGLVLHSVLKRREFDRFRVGGILAIFGFYIDDEAAAGTIRELRNLLAAFVPLAAAVGLNLNARKCVLYCNDAANSDIGEHGELFARKPLQQMEVLGCPCGDVVTSEANVMARFDKWRTMLNIITSLPNKHVAMCLLHFCASSTKVAHLMRAIGVSPVWSMADTMIEQAAVAIIGHPAMPDASRRQLALPIRLGGLGITSCALHAPAGNLVAVMHSIAWTHGEGNTDITSRDSAEHFMSVIHTVVDQNANNNNNNAPLRRQRVDVRAHWALERQCVALQASGITVPVDGMFRGFAAVLVNLRAIATAPVRGLNRTLSNSLETAARERLLFHLRGEPATSRALVPAAAAAAGGLNADAAAAVLPPFPSTVARWTEPLRHAAVIESASCKASGSWLYESCTATGPKLWLTDAEFVCAVYARLHVPAWTGPPRKCVRCNREGACDPYGQHTSICMQGGPRTLLHNAVNDIVVAVASAAGAMPRREAHPFPEEQGLRLDVVCTMPCDRDTKLLVDVALTYVLTPSAMQHRQFAPGAVAAHYERVKVAKYGPYMDAHPDCRLIPLVVDSLGGMAETGRNLLLLLAKSWAGRIGCPIPVCQSQVMHRIAFAVVRGFAQLAALPALADAQAL
jgi:hypothetical protein